MQQERILELKAGKLYFFTEGEYSDYSIIGAFVALQSVSEETMQTIVAELQQKQSATPYSVRCLNEEPHAIDAFLPELIRRGYLLDLDPTDIHIGSYGELELS